MGTLGICCSANIDKGNTEIVFSQLVDGLVG